MSGFKRKVYPTKVKPVKHKKVKLKKPDVRELKAIYSAIAKEGPWTKTDNICLAMAWYDQAVIWSKEQPEAITPKYLLKALSERSIKQCFSCQL
jgi:hypothetical protein